jgi:hypothetical protein
VDGTGSGSCPMGGFGISGVEPSGSATTKSDHCPPLVCSSVQRYEVASASYNYRISSPFN